MENKKIRIYSIINLTLAGIIVLAGIIQYNYNGLTLTQRRLRALIGYFVILPSLFISLYTLGFVIHYYYVNKSSRLLYLYRSLPALLIWIYVFIVFMLIFRDSFFSWNRFTWCWRNQLCLLMLERTYCRPNPFGW